MAAPDVIEDPDPDAEEAPDPTIEEPDLDDPELEADAGSLFSGDEDAGDADGGTPDMPDDDDDATGDADSVDVDDAISGTPTGRGPDIAGSINEGAARLAVVGLGEDEAGELEREFQDVFATFRLGFFAEEVAAQHMDGSDDIDPAWGLFGSALCCTALVMHRRSDGDEMLGDAKDAIKDLTNRSNDDSN